MVENQIQTKMKKFLFIKFTFNRNLKKYLFRITLIMDMEIAFIKLEAK
jgi:hypothetical protein